MPVAEAQYEPGISEVVEGTNRDTLSPSPDLSKYDFHTPSRYCGRSYVLFDAGHSNRCCLAIVGKLRGETVYHTS